MPETDDSGRMVVTVRPKSRKLLDLMCKAECRSVIDQMTVIIREAAERRGLVCAGGGGQPSSTLTIPRE